MKQETRNKNKIKEVGLFLLLVSCFLLPAVVSAQNEPKPITNPSNPGFKIVVCDGPDLSSVKGYGGKNPDGYVPCDFRGVMRQAQHLIDIAMVLGVLAAILGFSYAGWIYISSGFTGKSDAHTKALDIFQKVFLGFIIMLSAWFIIYQILAWLTNNPGFKALLGNPS